MKAKELRDLSEADLRQRLKDEQVELQAMRFQHAVTRLENPQILGQKRRVIAQIHTILGEKLRATA